MSAPNNLEDRIQKLRDQYALNNIYQTESLQIIDALQAQVAVLNQLLALEIKEDYPLVLALANSLGLDTEAIFTLAMSLN